jgi:UDP-glucose 4-epimerase
MQVRCFSDIEDDVDCLVEFALNDTAVGQTFNIGPDEEPITINDLAANIARLLQFDLKPIYMPGRPQEVKHATCSANKIRKYFGYETKVTLDQSLQKMIDYVSVRGVRKFEYHLPIEIASDKTPRTWTERLF